MKLCKICAENVQKLWNKIEQRLWKKIGQQLCKKFCKKKLGKKGNCEKNWRKKVTILCRYGKSNFTASLYSGPPYYTSIEVIEKLSL